MSQVRVGELVEASEARFVWVCVVVEVSEVFRGTEDSTYFPAANAEEEAKHIRLLLLLELFDILEGTHLDCWSERKILC